MTEIFRKNICQRWKMAAVVRITQIDNYDLKKIMLTVSVF